MATPGAAVLNMVALVTCISAFLMNIVCVIIPNWMHGRLVGRQVYVGVWQHCSVAPGIGSIRSRYSCRFIMDSAPYGWVRAVQAFVVMGVMTSLVGITLHLLYNTSTSCNTRPVAICASAANLVTAVFSLTGISVYAGVNPQGHQIDGYLWYSPAFYVEWVAILFYVIGVILDYICLHLAKRQSVSSSNYSA